MELTVLDDVSRQPLQKPFNLKEFHGYTLELVAHKVLFLGQELDSVDDRWVLETPFAVGSGFLEWWDDSGHNVLSLEIYPDPNKIKDRHTWTIMIQDIAHWGEQILGYTGVRLGGVTFGARYELLCVEAVHELLEHFTDLVLHISDTLPNVDSEGTISIHRIDSMSLLAVSSDVSVHRWLKGDRKNTHWLEIPSQDNQLDLAMVQHLKQCIEMVVSVVSNTIDRLYAENVSEYSWRNQRGLHLQSRMNTLYHLVQAPPWSTVRAAVGTETCIERLSVQEDLFRLHRLSQQICSPVFSMDAQTFPVSQRNSYTVYELWCFHVLVEQWSIITGVQPIWTFSEGTQSVWGASVKWINDHGTITVWYNLRFRAYWERVPGEPYSLVGEQRPDFVLKYGQRWLVLDAKYRSTRHNVLDAFHSAFSYAKSLRLSDDIDESEGCFLLVPKVLKESREWFDPAFHLANHFGLLHCSPQKSILLLRECMTTRLQYPQKAD